MASYFVSDGHGLTTRASCDFIKSLFHFLMVIKMDFKTLSGNENVYFRESDIVIIKRFNLFGRNRKLKESFRLFYKVFISTWKNYLYPIGDITKNRRCKNVFIYLVCTTTCRKKWSCSSIIQMRRWKAANPQLEPARNHLHVISFHFLNGDQNGI